MATTNLYLRLKPASKRLLGDVAKIAKAAKAKADETTEPEQLRAQIKTLAQAVLEVADYCASLHEALEAIAKNVTFTKQ